VQLWAVRLLRLTSATVLQDRVMVHIHVNVVNVSLLQRQLAALLQCGPAGYGRPEDWSSSVRTRVQIPWCGLWRGGSELLPSALCPRPQRRRCSQAPHLRDVRQRTWFGRQEYGSASLPQTVMCASSFLLAVNRIELNRFLFAESPITTTS